MTELAEIRDNVQQYYGQVLQSSKDLKTSACCASDCMPPLHKAIVAQIDEEILARSYGCGSPLPPALAGCTVLDLGCGTGRDVFIASKLVGETGHVIGVDMTDEQLDVARRHVEPQTKRFGHGHANVTFAKGYIEDLTSAGIADNSIDVVISNCVINLSADKRRVFAEIFRVLKPGGEMYIADVFANRRLPESCSADPILHGECLAGAMYIEDFRRMMADLGCPDYRVMARGVIAISDEAIRAKLGETSFTSLTFRAFKLESLEDRCEDFGQVAYYLGSIPECPQAFDLDEGHRLEKGRPMLVCGNSAAMLEETRYGKYFRIDGDRSTHFGLFGQSAKKAVVSSGGCC